MNCRHKVATASRLEQLAHLLTLHDKLAILPVLKQEFWMYSAFQP